jgi:hypothetical protein
MPERKAKQGLPVQLLFSYGLLIAGALTTLVLDMNWQGRKVKNYQE